METIPYSQFVGKNFDQAGSYVFAVADAARKSACSFLRWQQYRNPLFPEGDVGDAMRGFLIDRMCEQPGDPPLLPPPQPPSGESQTCVCGSYIVETIEKFKDGQPDRVSTDRLYGPISSFVNSSQIDNIPPGSFVIVYRGTPPGVCSPVPLFFGKRTNQGLISTSYVSKITPIEGAPIGDCDRPRFPTLPPFDPVPSDRPPPVRIPPAIGQPLVDIPIYFPDININNQFRFEPELHIDVGGINFTFDFSGMKFSFNNENNFTIKIPGFPPGNPPNVRPPILEPRPRDTPPPVVCPPVDLSLVLSRLLAIDQRVQQDIDLDEDALARIKGIEDYINNSLNPQLKDIADCACPPETEMIGSFQNVQTFTFEGGSAEIFFVTLLLIGGGRKDKTYSVPGGIRVTHAGWYSFGRGEFRGDRRPIDYDAMVMLAPFRNLDSWTFSLYNGLTASGTIYRRKV